MQRLSAVPVIGDLCTALGMFRKRKHDTEREPLPLQPHYVHSIVAPQTPPIARPISMPSSHLAPPPASNFPNQPHPSYSLPPHHPAVTYHAREYVHAPVPFPFFPADSQVHGFGPMSLPRDPRHPHQRK